MASKKKPTGCTSVRCIEDAMKKLGHSVFQFFYHAVQVQDVKNFDLHVEVEKFERLRKIGLIAVDQSYRIPQCILSAAEQALASKRPAQKSASRKPSRAPARHVIRQARA